MAWLQLKIKTSADQAQLLSETMETCGAISVSIEGHGGQDLLEADLYETPLWSQNWVTGLFPEHTDLAPVLENIKHGLGSPEIPSYETDLLTDQDWGYAWMAHYKPLRIVHNLWICPSWCAPPEPRAVNVILDPGLAFGTGDHPTTALCLEWLSEQDLENKTFIDYGCGSGILSIAALKLGAQRSLGVDIDPQALDVSRRNAMHNGMAERYQTFTPDTLPEHSYADIVIANILAEPLIKLAPRIINLVRPDGRLALSGLLNSQAEDVRRHYDTDFNLESRMRSEWVMFTGKKAAKLPEP